MAQIGEDGIIAVVGASPGRRILATGTSYLLGVILVYITFTMTPGLLSTVLLLVFAVAILLQGERVRRATAAQIVLRADAITDTSGQVLAEFADIQSIERGVFAFKPANGFMLKLKHKQPRSWAPGLWWRAGRYLGVGGAVSAGQAKFMAEQIAILLKQRAD